MKTKEELIEIAQKRNYSTVFKLLKKQGLGNNPTLALLIKEYTEGTSKNDAQYLDRVTTFINSLPDDFEIAETQTKIPFYKRKKVWFALGIVLPFLGFVGYANFTDECWAGRKRLDFVLKRSLFSPCDTAFNLLILPFTPDDCPLEKDIAIKIKRRLDELNRTENLQINSKILTDFRPDENFGEADAENLRSLHNASMIVHGYYSKGAGQCNSPNAKEICFFWQMDTTKNSQKYENVDLDLLQKGQLQTKIESSIFWIIANRNFERTNYAQALKHFLFLQDNLGEKTAKLKHNIGFCYAKQKQYEQAKNYYEQSIGLDSSYAAAYNNLGYLLMKNQAKNYTQVLKWFKLGLLADEKNEIILRNMLYFLREAEQNLSINSSQEEKLEVGKGYTILAKSAYQKTHKMPINIKEKYLASVHSYLYKAKTLGDPEAEILMQRLFETEGFEKEFEQKTGRKLNQD